MTASSLTDTPTTLRQWLLLRLLWTALCFGIVAATWLICDPLSIRSGEAGGGARMFVLLLAHVGVTVLLGRQLGGFEPLFRQMAGTCSQPLRLTARAWWVLLVLLTGASMLLDFLLLLLWLLVAADDGRSWSWSWS